MTKSKTGAPAQHNQPGRKGKRAWRKNVSIEDVEEGLEEIRTEERVTGSALQNKKDSELFQIDTVGDEKVRQSIPKAKRQLTSLKILAERSAVPAVSSRKRPYVSKEDRERLLRIAKRPRKGPFNSIIDPTESGAGSATLDLSEAVKNSGTYDPWQKMEGESVPDGLELVMKKSVKTPSHSHPRQDISIPAVPEPHQGTSYNPPVDAHQELLLQACAMEEKRVKDVEKLAEVKSRIENARTHVQEQEGLPPGMKLDNLAGGEEEGKSDSNLAVPKKNPERKTKQQRRKAASVVSEQRALAAKAAMKRMHAMINDIKSIGRHAEKTSKRRELVRLERVLRRQQNLKKNGLAGKKLGKHKVPVGEIDVQLGEDLSENLRALKPEGNLFRDRFLSLQQRALVEPRVRVLPTRRKLAIIEYEKHAWKEFQSP